jgi:hypothetical protein
MLGKTMKQQRSAIHSALTMAAGAIQSKPNHSKPDVVITTVQC